MIFDIGTQKFTATVFILRAIAQISETIKQSKNMIFHTHQSVSINLIFSILQTIHQPKNMNIHLCVYTIFLFKKFLSNKPVRNQKNMIHRQTSFGLILKGCPDSPSEVLSKIVEQHKNHKIQFNDEFEHLKTHGESNKFDLNTIPEQLRSFITPEVWESYSPARRESFANIFQNPNSFFYRNRPPGDPQIRGPFTAEEEKQFIQRINYFRNELKIYDRLWGLFAVPIKGRMGYQCMNFYRHLTDSGVLKKIKPKSDGTKRARSVVSPEVQKKLEDEAFQFILECLSRDTPITEPQSRYDYRSKSVSESSDYTSPSDVYDKGIDENNETKPPPRKSIKLKAPKTQSKNVKRESNFDKLSLIQFAPDPITGEPMEKPYLDPHSGVVMDKRSWKKIFKKKVCSPYDVYARDFNDLLYITASVLDEFRNQIVNVFI